jgi:hypothetical protein
LKIVIRAIVAATVLYGGPALALGDFAKRAERLPPLMLDAAKGFSIKEYKIQTGTYYRWQIESDGGEEYKVLAPDLFASSWIQHVSIEDKEVKPYGLQAVEFDDAGTIDVWFITLRPGKYKFWVEGLESQGFAGQFIVE